MPREPVERRVQEAVLRLSDGTPTRAPDTRLTDENLVIEAGVSRATVYRCRHAMDEWRRVKEASLRSALALAHASPPDVRSDTKALLRAARLDPTSLRTMPGDLIEDVQKFGAGVMTTVEERPEHIIDCLVTRVFALTVAVRQRDNLILELEKEVARLGGNIRPIRPARF